MGAVVPESPQVSSGVLKYRVVGGCDCKSRRVQFRLQSALTQRRAVEPLGERLKDARQGRRDRVDGHPNRWAVEILAVAEGRRGVQPIPEDLKVSRQCDIPRKLLAAAPSFADFPGVEWSAGVQQAEQSSNHLGLEGFDGEVG